MRKFIWLYKPCKSLEPCLFTQTNNTLWESWAVTNWQNVSSTLRLLTSRQCRAAMCGGKHTEPLPLCRPPRLHPDTPALPPLQLIGSTPEKRWSHLFWFTKAWNSLSGSTGKASSLASETAKSLSILQRGLGSHKTVGPDGVLLPTKLRSWLVAFPDALKWRFMGNL